MTIQREVVLVVDDSPATLGMLNEALEAAGYTVLVALSGTEALMLMSRISPDIVLMDAVMPGLDGFETCRQMKHMQSLASIPVVFMTGLTETEHVLRGLDAGGVDYVAKPVAPDEVVARVRVHLATARLTRSARTALDTAGRFLLAVSREGHLRWATPQAARLIREATGRPVGALPPPAVAWLATCLRQTGAKTELSINLEAAGNFPAAGELSIRITFVGEIGMDEVLLRVTSSQSEEVVLSQALGLTIRETEVLLWLSRGKSNRDIATILGLSPRTVNKHLEQIFGKLKVENRASATALAIRALGGVE